MKAKNISGRKLKVEYGFNTIRKRELISPDQIIEIDEFDFNYLASLGVWHNKEMIIINEDTNKILEDKMAQAKKDAENYINQNN